MLSQKKIKILLFIFIISIALCLGLYNYFKHNEFFYAGTIEVQTVSLASQVPTTILTFPVEEGQRVAAGDILATLSCEDIRLQQKFATSAYNLLREALKNNVILPIEQRKKIENEKEMTDAHAALCKIKAPFKGTVLSKFFEANEWVSPGMKLVTLANLDKTWTYFYVPQDVMLKLKVGQSVKGLIPETNTWIPGSIIKINDQAEFTPKNVQTLSDRTLLVFGIKVEFPNPNQLLKPGMTIESSL